MKAVTKETKLIATVNYTYAPQYGRDKEGLIGFTLYPEFRAEPALQISRSNR